MESVHNPDLKYNHETRRMYVIVWCPIHLSFRTDWVGKRGVSIVTIEVTIANFTNRKLDWSNCTCPNYDGFDKNLLTIAEFRHQFVTQPTHFQVKNRPSVLGPGVTKAHNII